MDEDEAIRKAVKAFYDGAGFSEYEKASGVPMKYSKIMFDDYEKQLRKTINKGKKKKEAEDVEA